MVTETISGEKSYSVTILRGLLISFYSVQKSHSIPEENETLSSFRGNKLSLPLNQGNRKESPIPNPLPDYMDMGMNSPYSSSPGEMPTNSNVYMPMSPVDYRGG